MAEFKKDIFTPGSSEGVVVQPNTLVESAPPLTIVYAEFKRLSLFEMAQIPEGTLIKDVKANELYTLQNWVSPDKVLRAAADFENGRCKTWPISYPRAIRGKPALVLGDGTHRSGLVISNGLRLIDVITASADRPIDLAKARPLRAVVNQFRDMFELEL